MLKEPDTTCEEFYFTRIAALEASPEDYRDFFERLWRANGETVFKYAYSRLGDLEDARDVCQDTFVRAMQFIQKNPGRIPPKVNFRAWLRVIVRNLVNDRFRKVLVRPHRASESLLETLPVEQPPEERMVTADALAILRKCIESLTERARMLIILRDIEGLSEKDIAAKAQSNPNAVSVSLHRARKTLRECVAMGHAERKE